VQSGNGLVLNQHLQLVEGYSTLATALWMMLPTRGDRRRARLDRAGQAHPAAYVAGRRPVVASVGAARAEAGSTRWAG